MRREVNSWTRDRGEAWKATARIRILSGTSRVVERLQSRFGSRPHRHRPRNAFHARTVTPDSRVPSALDARFAEISAWLDSVLGGDAASIEPASAVASFHRYFRVTLSRPEAIRGGEADAGTVMAMGAPPPQEACRPFLHVAKRMLPAVLNVPRVLAVDLPRGFLLLTDLGRETYLAALDERTAPP